jgi:hypothetical protein
MIKNVTYNNILLHRWDVVNCKSNAMHDKKMVRFEPNTDLYFSQVA